MKNSRRFDLEEIIIQYKPVVSFRVRRSIGSFTPDWEDIVNEIMVNTIDQLRSGTFRGDSSVGTFIYTITSRRIVDFIRQKNKSLKFAPEPNPYPAPPDILDQKERSEYLIAQIKNLKPKYREALYLYYYKELSRDEVAKKLGISPRRVSERINYAQKLLKKNMTK